MTTPASTHPPLADIAEMICGRLTSYRLSVSTEAALHVDVDRVLHTIYPLVEHEYDLGGGHGRIDFYIPELQIGLELKVKGGAALVARQLHRYCQSPKLRALVLVTTNPLHSRLPKEINGVSLHLALTARGWA